MATSKSFLDLPQDLRVRTYNLSGLVRACPIDLLKERKRKSTISSIPELLKATYQVYDCRFSAYGPPETFVIAGQLRDFECYCETLPLQLLFLCRAIHYEVVPILYGQNVLKAEWLSGGREAFQSLSLLAQRSIRSLQIFLGWPRRARYESPRPLKQLEELFSIISEGCTIDKLHMTLDCDVSNMARSGPNSQFLALLPKFKSFAIRFDKMLQPWSKLSKDVVAVAPSDPQLYNRGFPFMKLPPELRHQVLRYSDLVVKPSPHRWVDGVVVGDGEFTIHLTDVWRGRCCGTCSTSSAICCCPLLVAGFSQTCTCYTLPRNFLSVSHEFAKDAREVLFRNNRFIFSGHPTKTLSFLKRQPTEVLWLIQAIDFHFAFEDPGLWKADRTAESSWRELLVFLSQSLNISNLWLTIDTGSAFETYRAWMLSNESARDVLQFYYSLIDPIEEIATFKGLRRFHVFLALFWSYETDAEKAVKGPDYDSAKDGKIPRTRRNPYYPHGVPDPSMEWELGMGE